MQNQYTTRQLALRVNSKRLTPKKPKRPTFSCPEAEMMYDYQQSFYPEPSKIERLRCRIMVAGIINRQSEQMIASSERSFGLNPPSKGRARKANKKKGSRYAAQLSEALMRQRNVEKLVEKATNQISSGSIAANEDTSINKAGLYKSQHCESVKFINFV